MICKVFVSEKLLNVGNNSVCCIKFIAVPSLLLSTMVALISSNTAANCEFKQLSRSLEKNEFDYLQPRKSSKKTATITTTTETVTKANPGKGNRILSYHQFLTKNKVSREIGHMVHIKEGNQSMKPSEKVRH